MVGSIWGRTVQEFAEAAEATARRERVALEVNASCPNLESRSTIFAHSALATAEIVRAAKVAALPLWVKLSPNTPELVADRRRGPGRRRGRAGARQHRARARVSTSSVDDSRSATVGAA